MSKDQCLKTAESEYAGPRGARELHFTLIKLSVFKDKRGRDAYLAKAMEHAGAQSFFTQFRDEEDMVHVMDGILAKQLKRYVTVRMLLQRIHAGDVFAEWMPFSSAGDRLCWNKPQPFEGAI